MSVFLNNTARVASVAAFVLLAGCGQQTPAPAPAPQPVAYNPPAPTATTSDATWYHVMFDTNSSRISMDGRQTIGSAIASMQGNPALTATLVGKTDSVGSDAANMRLSKQRAGAVRMALLQSGKISPKRIVTRWTGERQQGGQAMSHGADANSRVVDIGVQ